MPWRRGVLSAGLCRLCAGLGAPPLQPGAPKAFAIPPPSSKRPAGTKPWLVHAERPPALLPWEKPPRRGSFPALPRLRALEAARTPREPRSAAPASPGDMGAGGVPCTCKLSPGGFTRGDNKLQELRARLGRGEEKGEHPVNEINQPPGSPCAAGRPASNGDAGCRDLASIPTAALLCFTWDVCPTARPGHFVHRDGRPGTRCRRV